MKIRILGENMDNCSNKNYRGLYREEPRYIEDDDILKHWNWYATEAGDGGYITDVEKSIELIKEYRNKGIIYEMVFIESKECESDKSFLGIDVASIGGYSLLSNGLKEEENVERKTTEFDGIFELII